MKTLHLINGLLICGIILGAVLAQRTIVLGADVAVSQHGEHCFWVVKKTKLGTHKKVEGVCL